MREARRYVASILLGLVIANTGTNFWLTYKYIATRPTVPDKTLGLIHPLNNHGTYYYLTTIESASVNLTFWLAWFVFMLVLIVVPKDFLIPPPSTPRWVSRVSASFRTGLEQFKLGYFAAMAAGFLMSIAICILFGADLVRFAIAHGVVAH